VGWVGPTGSVQTGRIRDFFEKYIQCKTISREIIENVLRHEKYSKNLKIPRKTRTDRLGYEHAK
jgi:hypothetical protein